MYIGTYIQRKGEMERRESIAPPIGKIGICE